MREGSDQGNRIHAVGGGFIDPVLLPQDKNSENFVPVPEHPFHTCQREIGEETTVDIGLDFEEDLDSEIRFDKHCFSDPESWYQLRFLELLVKEVKCAYSILKIIDWYANCLRNRISLPFKVSDIEPQMRVENDIRDLDEAFDNLCDFLLGEGDFKLDGVTAISEDKGYLDWLEKALKQLPEVGRSLGSEKVFNDCVENVSFWLLKLGDFLENRDDSLSKRITEILSRI